MLKYIKKNQKTMLTIFSAFLMLAFVATMGPSNCNNRRGGSSDASLAGTIGKEKVTVDEVQESAEEWRTLAQKLAVRVHGQDGQEQWVSIVDTALLPDEVQTGQPAMPTIHLLQQQMQRQPEVYHLLLLEARKMGMEPDMDQATYLLSDPNVGINMPDGSRVAYDNVTDQNLKDAIKYYLADYLMVADAFHRAAESVKVSQALVNYNLAQRLQELKLQVVDFSANDYLPKVAAPTGEQLQKQFDQFSAFEPDTQATTTNPFGFGYKYPNRVKVQYVEIPHDQVRQAVMASKSDYQWSVDANRYYLEHQQLFPTTEPATTGPTTAMSLAAALPPAPTTRPFEEVKDEVMTRLLDPQIASMEAQVQSLITTRLTQIYQSKPTTNPESFGDLQALAKEVQDKFHVTLTVASIADSYKTAKDLKALPNIGALPAFPDYVMAAGEAFVPESEKGSSAVLHTMQPSRPLTDENSNTFIFRITAMQPAHKPDSLDEVKDQVAHDWKLITAYDMAKTDAQKLLDAAKNSKLEMVASSKVKVIGPFPLDPYLPIENYHLESRSQIDLMRQCGQLMAELKSQPDKQPITLVEMPADSKVAVAALLDLIPRVPSEFIEQYKPMMANGIGQQMQAELVPSWFSFQGVSQRLGYQDAKNQQ